LAAYVLVAGCGGDGGSNNAGGGSCPAGTYVGSAVRSTATPGDCPSSLDPSQIAWMPEDITIAMGESCNHLGFFSVSNNDCSFDETSMVSPKGAGLAGLGMLDVKCSSVTGVAECFANYDLTYTRQ
jgi:hypothetical protein